MINKKIISYGKMDLYCPSLLKIHLMFFVVLFLTVNKLRLGDDKRWFCVVLAALSNSYKGCLLSYSWECISVCLFTKWEAL